MICFEIHYLVPIWSTVKTIGVSIAGDRFNDQIQPILILIMKKRC